MRYSVNADGVFRAREIRRLTPQSRWDKEAVNNVIGALWRKTDGRWTVDGREIRVDPTSIPPMPFEGARILRERMTKQDVDDFGATVGCPSCNAIKDNKREQSSIQIIAECELKNVSESLSRFTASSVATSGLHISATRFLNATIPSSVSLFRVISR